MYVFIKVPVLQEETATIRTRAEGNSIMEKKRILTAAPYKIWLKQVNFKCDLILLLQRK